MSDDGTSSRRSGSAGQVERLPRSPAAERNKEPILAVLRDVLPAAGTILEIASGTGQHAAYFAGALPALSWQPSEQDASLLVSIERRTSGSRNVAAPVLLDASEFPWPVASAAAVVAINLLHIAPWAATRGLLRGAAEVLPVGAPLVIYGPFRRAGHATAPSNEAFDASLKARDPRLGLRDLERVAQAGGECGLDLEQTFEMPANNLTVVLRR